MKRALPLVLVLALVLAGCTGGPEAATKTPEELTEAYRSAIIGARDEELNQAYSIVTDPADDMAETVFAVMGVDRGDVTAFAVSVSLMNVKAYTVACLMPVSGREEAVQKGLEGYVENMKQSFQFYLEDQYEVAKAARIQSLADGTLVLVMCQDQDGVFHAIQEALER